jgi:hypothetical protein
LRHIQAGKRRKSASASTASRSAPAPRTYRLTRYASGQSASTATAANPCSSINRRVDERALPVELVGAVRRFAEQDDARLAEHLDEPVVTRRAVVERQGPAPDHVHGIDRPVRVVRRRRPAGAREQPRHLVVARLAEVAVPEPDGLERLGHGWTDDPIGQPRQPVARLPRADGHGDDDLRRRARAQRDDGRLHRCARCQAVVDQDHGAALDRRRAPAGAVARVVPIDLEPLACGHLRDGCAREAQAPHEVVVQHLGAVFGDRAEGQLLVPGHAELAHEEDVERRVERARHLSGDGHAAAGQGEHQRIAASRVLAQRVRQHPARVGAVGKTRGGHGRLLSRR